jgi:signal transduction histidine kinase
MAYKDLQLESTNLNELLARVLENFSPAIEKKGIRVVVKAQPPPLVVAGDRNRLTRILRSLCDNAVRYTPADNPVVIQLTSGSRHISVDFINPAGGLLAEDVPFLFERFYRGEKSRSRQHGGAGIGLAIVKELVEAHGGSVHAELSDGMAQIGFRLPSHPPQL